MLIVLYIAIGLVFCIGFAMLYANSEVAAKRTGVAMLGIALFGGIALYAIVTARDVASDVNVGVDVKGDVGLKAGGGK